MNACLTNGTRAQCRIQTLKNLPIMHNTIIFKVKLKKNGGCGRYVCTCAYMQTGTFFKQNGYDLISDIF